MSLNSWLKIIVLLSLKKGIPTQYVWDVLCLKKSHRELGLVENLLTLENSGLVKKIS